MRLPVVHSPEFETPLLRRNRFPMPKYGLVADFLANDGIADRGSFYTPAPAPAQWVQLAHDRVYVDQVFNANVPPEISRQIGFDITQGVALRSRHASAGTLLCARLALEHGIACSTAGGSHHAMRAHGRGFCVFNDVGVASSVLLADGTIGTALVLDCDVHQGDGTAEIFRDEPRVKTISIHGEKNYPARKQQSDIDVALPDGTGDEAYLEALDQVLERCLAFGTPDIVFYNAGVDPHRDDLLGRLALSDGGLEERDRRAIGFFRERGIAVAGVLGGGYGDDVNAVARRHTILHRVAVQFI
ncbi:MAG: histone deacetylase [Rhizobiaceae bacterium]